MTDNKKVIMKGTEKAIEDFLSTIKYCPYGDVDCVNFTRCGDVCGLYNVQFNIIVDRKEYKEKE